MDHPQRAVFFLEEDSSIPAHAKPLMLEAVLFCPILRWMSEKLLADGVQRFFVVCGPRFAQEARACLPGLSPQLQGALNTPQLFAHGQLAKQVSFGFIHLVILL